MIKASMSEKCEINNNSSLPEAVLPSGSVFNTHMVFPHALLINASAGSGKTYTLAQRYAMFLISTTADSSLRNPENIIAVTFTNNAAKEMKQRILKYLKDLALGCNPDIHKICAALRLEEAEVRRRSGEMVDRLLDCYSDFQVQTIDSFFSGIFRLSAAELNYSADIETKFSAENIIDNAVMAVISMAGRSGRFDEKTVDRFLSLLPGDQSFVWNPAEAMKKTFSGFMSMESSLPYTLSAERSSGDKTLGIFREALELYREILGKVPEEYIRTAMRSVEDINSPSVLLERYYGTRSFFNGRIKWEKILSAVPEAEEYRKCMDKKIAELAEAYSFSYYQPYTELYPLFREKAELIKRRITNAITVSDISKCLSGYISENTVPEIYYNLGSRLNHFMIDEFQDTNRLQWNIMLPLIEEALSTRGSLFLVGDIKQAIYRFRHADYKIMSSLLPGGSVEESGLSTGMLPHGLECENLPVNYRSGGVITDYVAEVFRKRLPQLQQQYGLPDMTGLSSYIQAPENKNINKGYVHCELMSKKKGEKNSYAERLVTLVESAAKRHPLRDIAVLVDRNSTVEAVVSLLSSRKIPSASFSSLDIRKRPVIAEIISLLRFLDEPQDDISFFNFINGSIFSRASGLMSAEIHDFLCGRTDKELLYVYFRRHEVFMQLWEKLFQPLFSKSGYLPLYELICQIYVTFSLFDNFPEEQAALAKFQEAAATSSSRGMNTISSFLDYADSESGPDEDSKKEFAVALPEALNAVQVMTWHKSKGLGFPVVINIIDINRGRTSGMTYRENNDSLYPVYSVSEIEKNSALLKAWKKAEKTEELVQKLNTFYVICTRAKEELYNLVLPEEEKEDKSGESEKELPDAREIFFDYEAGSVNKEGTETEELPASLKVPVGRTDRKFVLNEPSCTVRDVDIRTRRRGELLHAVISAFENTVDIVSVAGIYDRLSGFYSTDDSYRNEDIAILEKFISCSEAALFFPEYGKCDVFSEREYLDRSGNMVRVDRVIITDSEVIAVDFKTGAESPEYEKQVKNYMSILAGVYGKPVRGFLAYIDPVNIREVFL